MLLIFVKSFRRNFCAHVDKICKQMRVTGEHVTYKYDINIRYFVF